MANQDLVYDITKVPDLQVEQQAIYGRVGDGGLKAVTVKVLSNRYDYDLTGLSVRFEGVKPDGTHIIDANGGTVLDPQAGVFRYVFPAQTFTAKGVYNQAFFKIMRGDQTDSTIEVRVEVAPNRVEFGINSVSYLSEYQELINKITDKEEAFEEGLVKRAKDLSDRMDTLQSRLDANDFVNRVEYGEHLEDMKKHALLDVGSYKETD
ncbi:phage baseplate upper protein [Pediococcus stilesii]|uniref:Phage baseplate upper protein n=1 Tax=Pediococcus stilesii TaxID=331679 RepID=A0A5R9BSG6_9LACO|nr:phage baseplate upper protein [Pediococcus stilesii]TLQ03656.1 phage baseplate upper protein [Pediococcus stilesii]